MAKIFARPDDDITPLTIGRLTDAFMAFGAGTSTSLSGENAYVDLLKKFGESRATPVDDTTRQFIKLERTFNAQLAESETWFPGQTNYALREKMQLSAELLLHCLPDAISLQLTDEGRDVLRQCEQVVRALEAQMLAGIEPDVASSVQGHLEIFVRNLRG